MPKRLSSMHARTICHATEDPEKVELALRAVVGDAVVQRSRTEGHHGNAIEVLESHVDDEESVLDVLRRMTAADLEAVCSSLHDRIDDACHLFLRLDKQEAYAGRLKLCEGEDVVAVRIKVRSFPARKELAAETMGDLLKEIISSGTGKGCCP